MTSGPDTRPSARAPVAKLALASCIGIVLLSCEDGAAPTAAPPATPPPAPQPPNAPANLRVSAAGEDFVEWSWDAVAGAAGYEVQFSLDAEFTDADEVIDTAGGTTYRRGALAPATSVFLRVRAYAETAGERLRSGWTVALPAMTLAPSPPDAPANLRVSGSGEDFVEWRWNAVAGAAGYEVQFRLDGEFTDGGEVIDTSVQTVYRRGGLPAGTSAFLRVRAYAVVGELRLRSGWTVALPAMTPAPSPPDAPANLWVSDNGEDFIEWRWDAVEGVTGYEVQFSRDAEFTDADEVIDTAARTVYRRGELPAGTSAFLRVRAYAVVGDLRLRSGWTVALPATTLAPSPPNAPENLRVSGTGRDFIEWRWDAVAAAAGYEVQFSLDDEFAGADEVIDTAGRTVYRREGLPAGQSAFLRVRSYTETAGELLRSGWTMALPAMTLAPSPPNAPANLRVSDAGRDYLEWRWDAAAGTAGYEVQFRLDNEFTEADEVIDTAGRTVYRREELPAGQSAFLRVRSYAETAGERLRSGWTVALPAMTLAPSPPDAPANLRVSGSGEDFVEWRWDPIAEATGYEIQFSLDDEFLEADEVIDTSGRTVYRREGLPAGTSAFLRVRSYAETADDRLRSGWTVAVPAMTLAPTVTSLEASGTAVLTSIGETSQLMVTATLSDGSMQAVEAAEADWESSDPAVGHGGGRPPDGRGRGECDDHGHLRGPVSRDTGVRSYFPADGGHGARPLCLAGGPAVPGRLQRGDHERDRGPAVVVPRPDRRADLLTLREHAGALPFARTRELLCPR